MKGVFIRLKNVLYSELSAPDSSLGLGSMRFNFKFKFVGNFHPRLLIVFSWTSVSGLTFPRVY